MRRKRKLFHILPQKQMGAYFFKLEIVGGLSIFHGFADYLKDQNLRKAMKNNQ